MPSRAASEKRCRTQHHGEFLFNSQTLPAPASYCEQSSSTAKVETENEERPLASWAVLQGLPPWVASCCTSWGAVWNFRGSGESQGGIILVMRKRPKALDF